MLSHSPGSSAAELALDALDQLQIRIVVPDSIPPPAAAAAAGLIALCGRLFAHVQVDGDAALPFNPWGVATIGDVLTVLEWIRLQPTRPATRTVTVGFGTTDAAVDLSCGGGAYTVRLGRSPQPFDIDEITRFGHALGIHAAAAFAAAQLVGQALRTVGHPTVMIQDALTWNLLDYRLTPAPTETGPASSRPVEILLAGTGSVGSSAAAALAMSPGVTGSIICVDEETFDGVRNGFRYPGLGATSAGFKADWASDLLTHAGWNAKPFVGTIGAWTVAQQGPGFDGLLVSSVDTYPARFDVADVLAREVCSLGVAGTALNMQRERLGDGYACPFCNFVATDPPLTQAHVIAEQIGFDAGGVEAVIALQQPGAVLTRHHIEQAVRSGRIRGDHAEDLVGRRLDDLIARSYAETTVTAPGDGSAVAVAAPQVAWLSGILAAAEIAKDAAGLPPLDRRLDVDLRGLPLGSTGKRAQDQSGRCACASAHRTGWMRRLYPTVGST